MTYIQKIIRNFFFVLIIATVAMSCENEQKNNHIDDAGPKDTAKQQTAASTPDVVSTKEVNLSSGKTIVVTETHPKGASLSNIAIYFKEDTTTKLSLSDIDPISNILTADLDGNKFDEIYIVSSSVGTGSYSVIKGFASNNDKSLSFVLFPEVEEKDLQKGGLFEGYEGGDAYKVEQKKLIRSFPLKGNVEKTKAIKYSLQKGEAGFILKASK